MSATGIAWRRAFEHSLRLAFISLALCLPASCADKGKFGLTLDSGVDRKVASYPESDSAAPAYSGAGSTASQPPPAAAESAAAGLDQRGGSTAAQMRLDLRLRKGHSLTQLPNIGTFFLPEAYAAEHPIGDKYIVRTGSLEIQTAAVKDAISAITQTALKYGGGVTDTNISKDARGYRSGYITMRVPSEHFFEAWNELVMIDDVVSQQIKSEDRGSDFVSAVSQMNSLLAEQAALQKMYDEALAIHRSRGLREGYSTLLDTQRRLGEVNDQIRQLEESLTQLADQIAFSTITVNLSEQARDGKAAAASGGPFNWGLGATFNTAAQESMGSLRAVLQSLIYFAVSLRWVIWLALFFILRWVWKRWLHAGQGQGSAQRA